MCARARARARARVCVCVCVFLCVCGSVVSVTVFENISHSLGPGSPSPLVHSLQVRGTKENKDAVIAAINALSPGGPTTMFDAFALAYDLLEVRLPSRPWEAL